MFAPSRFCFSIFCALIAVTVAGLTPEARAVAPLAPSNIKVDMTLAVDADSAAQAGISYDSSATYLIRWTDNAFDEEGYRVEVRLGNGGPFTPLQYLRGNSDACLVWLPHFPKNTLLQFMVYAYKSNGAAVEASAAPVFSHMVGLSSSPITPIPPPIAPTNLTAELVGDGVVKLKWTDNGKDEVYHQVLYKKHGDTDFESVGYVYFNVTEAAMQPGLIPGEVYDFQVRATRKAPKDGVSFGGQSHVSTLSNTATVTAPPLLAPTHLTGVVTGEATVRLSWKDNSTNETGYQLEYKELPNGTFITPSWAVVAANTSTITVPVSPGIFTEWRVRAIYKEEGMSAAVESAATDPTLTLGTEFPAPSDLVAVTSPKAGAVDLAWKDNTSAETGFDILSRRAGSEDNFTLALSVPGGTTTATITSRLNNDGTDTVLLELDQTHEFKVLAKYGSVSSAATAVATAAAKHGFTSRFYNGGTVGEEYTSVNRYVLQTDQDVTVTEGVKNWNIANLEQVGLSFNNSSGVVEGTPTQHGIHTFPLTATFANGWVAHGTLTLRILRARADVVAGPIPNTTIAPKTTFNISLADKFSDPESERAVRLETTKGNIDILLYPSLAPEAVANFLAYVEAGDYNGVVFHRSLPGFVIQAGALKAVAAPKSYSSVAARPSPKNEPGISNLTGTISAAKVDKNPHSATHDFFLNLVDNNVDNPLSSVPALDNQNGGFTVFGRVATPAANRAQGLDVVYPVLHAIASLPRGNYYDFNSGGTYNESLDKSVLVDGFSANFADWPMDVSDSAPADMNLLKNVFIEKAYEIPTISHSVFSNSAPEVVSASIVNGELQVRGLKEGVAEVVVKGTDLENTAAQSTFQVTVTPNHKGPVITKHPASLVVMPGAKATFTVTATGTALTYQWRKRDGSGNFVNLGGETGKSLVIDGVQVANTGIYDVIVTNATTSLTSNPASLDFKTAPAITNPQPRVVNVGQPLTLEIEATGAPAPAIAWLRGTTVVGGQTKPKLSIAAAKLTDGGVYTARATNPSGKVTSAAANVYVVDPATALTTLKLGAKATLKAPASGPISGYQWRKNGVPITDSDRITGSSGPVLTISNVGYGDSDSYTCALTLPDASLEPVVTGVQKLAVVVRPTMSDYTAATGVVGFQYDFTVPYDPAITNTPTKFILTRLPPGLTYDAKTGRITGRPLKAGRYLVGTVIGNIIGNSNSATGTLDILPMSQFAVGSFVAAVEPSMLNANKGGRLDLTTLDTGAYTGKLTLGPESYSIKGALVYFPGAFAPQAQIIIARKGKSPLLLSFAVDESDGNIVGQLTDGLIVSSLRGFRQFWNASWNPSGFFSGNYNVALNLKSADVGNAAIPQGSGYATIKVSLGGMASVTTRLPDNTSITSSSLVGPRGEFLIFQMLYKNTGSVLGTPGLGSTNLGTNAQRIVRVAGGFRWIKDAQTAVSERTYKAGFGPLDMELIGRTYYAPAAGTRIMGLLPGTDNVTVDFSQAGLAAASINPDIAVTVPVSNVLQVPAVGSPLNPAKVKMSLNALTGFYSGSFELSDPTFAKRSATFHGLLVPKIPATPAVAATDTTAAVAEIPETDPQSFGYFLLPQLPSAGPPPTTTATSPILSGRVQLKPKAITIDSLVTDPAADVVNPGTAYSFTVSATGDGALTYQWRKDGVNIPNATAAVYSIASVQEAHQGSYDVVVSNASTSTTSQQVALNVNDPVSNIVITRSPSGSAVSEGRTVVFTATAHGTGPLTYQWYKNGGILDGETGATYTIASVNETDHAGSYTVRISNGVTTAGLMSSAVSLEIAEGVTSAVATRTPSLHTVMSGQTVTFHVAATGGGSLSYQWRKDGINLQGETDINYVISPTNEEHTGVYDVVVTSSITEVGVPSNPVPLTISDGVANVVATKTPNDAVVAVDTAVTFSVTATGLGSFTYQWRKNGVNLVGETSPTLVPATDVAGEFAYDVIVSSERTPDGVVSNSVPLIVAIPVFDVTVGGDPQGDIPAGTPVTLSVQAGGTGPLFYQWRKDGDAIDGQTADTFIIPSAGVEHNGTYDVVVTNAVSTVPSAPVTINVVTP